MKNIAWELNDDMEMVGISYEDTETDYLELRKVLMLENGLTRSFDMNDISDILGKNYYVEYIDDDNLCNYIYGKATYIIDYILEDILDSQDQEYRMAMGKVLKALLKINEYQRCLVRVYVDDYDFTIKEVIKEEVINVHI